MKTIKIWDIPNTVPNLEFDGDKEDLRLHCDDRYSWGCKGVRQYKKAEKEIDKFEIKGNGWIIYGSYDCSGFHYWMKQMEEPNHLHLTVSFDKEDINEDELVKIDCALDDAINWAETFAERYNYDPSPYNVTIPY